MRLRRLLEPRPLSFRGLTRGRGEVHPPVLLERAQGIGVKRSRNTRPGPRRAGGSRSRVKRGVRAQAALAVPRDRGCPAASHGSPRVLAEDRSREQSRRQVGAAQSPPADERSANCGPAGPGPSFSQRTGLPWATLWTSPGCVRPKKPDTKATCGVTHVQQALRRGRSWRQDIC